jgi:hypothetical protein
MGFAAVCRYQCEIKGREGRERLGNIHMCALMFVL